MASDYLLIIDGIKGESSDNKHPGSIEIESFSWGETNSAAGTGGGGAGKVSMQDFNFAGPVSQASPQLFLSCASGEHLKLATLFVRKAGGKQEDYLTIKMTDVLVSSYKQNAEMGERSSIPTDQFSLNFSKIEIDYKRQNADGSLGAPVTAGWDLKTNKKI